MVVNSGPYLEQKILIHFFRIRPHFQVTRTLHVSVLIWFHCLLSLSSVINCLCLVNCSVSPSLLSPTRSKVWLEQMLKMSPLVRTHASAHRLISRYTLPNPRWRISIAVVLIFATSSSLLAISVSYMPPQRKKSSGVRSGNLSGQATGLPLPVTIGVLEVWNVLEHSLVDTIDVVTVKAYHPTSA